MASGPRMLAGRYEVGRLLGRGGMAEVHQGLDTRLGRQVAVKLLRPDLARDPSFQARFRREAQSAAALNHPSIVAVYDTGEDVVLEPGGHEARLPFIVMEYVEGHTLRAVLRGEHLAATGTSGDTGEEGTAWLSTPGGGIRQQGMTIDRAVTMTAGVLAALEYSHRSGIVHRDIKPANVMLTPRGDVKVMDFGIARAMADTSATMTQTQAVIGTAQYLSPEQARGEKVDARSDLYSAGCLLYELLTGRPPFIGDSPVSVAYQHVREIPQPPSTHTPDISEGLDRVVLKALAKDREDRYADAGAFRDDLLAAAEGRPVMAPAVVGATAVGATQAFPVTEPTRTFAARTADPTQTVTIGRVEEDDEPRRGRVAGYLLLALAVLAVFALAAFLASQLFGRESAAPTELRVPNLIGSTAEQAQTKLEGMNLVYAEGDSVNTEEQPAGSVADQLPVAETLIVANQTVTVVLSLGVAEVEIPDVVEQSESQARGTLAGVGLEGGEATRQDDIKAQEGDVISTDPAVGESVPEGTVVALVISSGQVALENLVDLTYQKARDQVVALGLDLEPILFEASDKPEGTVIRQEPGPGKVDQGTVVTIVAAAPPVPTPTPTPSETASTPPPATGTPTPTETPPVDPPGPG